jgi:hypothetical protein
LAFSSLAFSYPFALRELGVDLESMAKEEQKDKKKPEKKKPIEDMLK